MRKCSNKLHGSFANCSCNFTVNNCIYKVSLCEFVICARRGRASGLCMQAQHVKTNTGKSIQLQKNCSRNGAVVVFDRLNYLTPYLICGPMYWVPPIHTPKVVVVVFFFGGLTLTLSNTPIFYIGRITSCIFGGNATKEKDANFFIFIFIFSF